MERDNRRFTRLVIGGRSENHPPDSSSYSTEQATSAKSTIPKLRESHPVDLHQPHQTTNQPPPAPELIQTVIKTSFGTPWKHYIKSSIELVDLAGKVKIARKQESPSVNVAIRKFPKQNSKDVLSYASQFKHHNIISVLEAFFTDSSFYLVFEEAFQCLEHLVQSPIYPTCEQLAIILGQVSSKKTSGSSERTLIRVGPGWFNLYRKWWIPNRLAYLRQMSNY